MIYHELPCRQDNHEKKFMDMDQIKQIYENDAQNIIRTWFRYFLTYFWIWNFIKETAVDYMHQNVELFSEDIKEGLDAIKGAATSLEICTQSKHMCIGLFPKFLHMFNNKNTYKLYSVFLQHYRKT